MLAVVQFPFADIRPFVRGDLPRSRPPQWPVRLNIPPEFVHGFGRAVPRYRGVDRAWLDENVYCRANQALKFSKLSRRGPGTRHTHCAFRRLLTDGEAVSRLEVGIGWLPIEVQTDMWQVWDQQREMKIDPTEFLARLNIDEEPLSVVDRVISLQTVVHPMAGETKPRPLIVQGPSLSKLYCVATSKNAASAPIKGVFAGAPIVLVECRSHWLDSLPREFVHVDSASAVKLAFGRHHSPWGALGVWLLGVEHASIAESRSIRLCLLRLHAEQEVLDLVLGNLANGHLTYDPDDPLGPRLESYLNRATRIVFRQEWSGIDQSAILAAFDAVGHTSLRPPRENLVNRLEGARRQVVAKLKAFEERTYIRTERLLYVDKREVIMGNKTTIGSIANSIVNINSTLEGVSQSIQAMPKASPDDRKELEELVKTLQKQLEAAAQQKPEEAQAVALQAKSLVEQATQDKPNKTSINITKEGLMDAAKAVADIAPTVLETAASIGKWIARVVLL